MTNQVFYGVLDGLQGAAVACQEEAVAAGLPGRYAPWLSDRDDSPSEFFIRATSPYTLVTGTVVAHNWADLTSGAIRAPINMTAGGVTITDGASLQAWTNTRTNGTHLDNKDCSLWFSNEGQGNVGAITATNANWTASDTVTCAGGVFVKRLYCFQQT